MTDIVERLRANPHLASALEYEAAEEIEKLRAVLHTIADFAPGHGDVCEIIAQRARDALRER